MILGFQQNDNPPPPLAHNQRLEYPRTTKKLNDTLHTSSVKYDIYQKVHYLHNGSIYLIPTHLTRAFEILDKLIARRMHAEDKNTERK